MNIASDPSGVPRTQGAEACVDPPQASAVVQHLLNDEPANVAMVAPLRDTVRSLFADLRALNVRLDTLNSRLLEADARKDVFLAILSHELRNPLAPIRIASQLLQSKNTNSNEVKIANAIIGRQVTHLSSLLDDLLDVSRITRGVFVLRKEPADLQALLDGAVEAVRPGMGAKGHTLRLEQQAPSLRIEVDPVRITQVITNLLINAAKYTPNGGVISLISRLEAQHLVIAVKDNGVGIAPDAIDKVFDMFTRIEPAATPSEGGLGIGLALVKGLMTLHGGQIQVHSAGRAKGSEFSIYFPRSLIVDTALQTVEPPRDVSHLTVRRKILIADDNEDGAETMKLLLLSAGHEVHVAHGGAQALEIAARVRPDVALLDIGMPDMSGYEVAQSIRHESWGKGMLLIAATGWGQPSDKRHALAAGFDQHLTKPIDPTRLEQLFERSQSSF